MTRALITAALLGGASALALCPAHADTSQPAAPQNDAGKLTKGILDPGRLPPQVSRGATPVNDANYTVLPTDSTVVFTGLTATRTASLGPSSTYYTGKPITIIFGSSSVSPPPMIVIAPSGTELIGPSPNPVALMGPGSHLVLQPLPSGGFSRP